MKFKNICQSCKKYLTCQFDKDVFFMNNSLKQNINDELLNIGVFNEKVPTEQSNGIAHQILSDGEKALSLDTIIKTRLDKLDSIVFEIELNSAENRFL